MLIHFNNGQRTTDNGYPSYSKLVVIVAGEASADLHGSNLVMAMKRLHPDIEFRGIGGEKMAQAGVSILFSSSEMAVVGLTEVFSKLRTIFRASKNLKRILKNDRPDLLILIDYPDFNIHIARTAKRFKIPVLYYISPQVWAWRRGRIKKIARRIDRMAVILPFEKAIYSEKPIKVDYVGHPLLDGFPQYLIQNRGALKTGMDQGRPVVGLLPGSRKEEIRNLLPAMVDAAAILGKRYPDLHCILPLAPGIEQDFVQPFVDNSDVTIKLCQGDIYESLSLCDAALVTSGTATLETAIMGVPMVIIYRVSKVSYWIGRMVIKVPYMGLVNLVAEEEVVPELVQDEVTADRLAHEIMTIFDDTEVREGMRKNLALVREKLGKGGASARTAGIALEMMK
jgi:lipid-A-disaccharide synthase